MCIASLFRSGREVVPAAADQRDVPDVQLEVVLLAYPRRRARRTPPPERRGCGRTARTRDGGARPRGGRTTDRAVGARARRVPTRASESRVRYTVDRWISGCASWTRVARSSAVRCSLVRASSSITSRRAVVTRRPSARSASSGSRLLLAHARHPLPCRTRRATARCSHLVRTLDLGNSLFLNAYRRAVLFIRSAALFRSIERRAAPLRGGEPWNRRVEGNS